jgi:hypothetical protein
MARLKDRQRQIPGGYRIKISAFKYNSPPFPSFDSLVREVQRMVNANPKLAQQVGLPTEFHKIEEWVDAYNADICERNGWNTYIMGGGAPPKWIAPTLLRRLGVERVAAGAKALLAWLGEGAEPVPAQMAEKRSSICAGCPLNQKVGLTDYFMRAASEMIRRQIEFSKDVGLSTTHDERIGICSACSCPLRLMVWVPLEHKLASLDEETFSKLPEHCWVKKEKNALDIAGKNSVSLQPQQVT